jgi:lysosomal acid lipase/cholesteryl ester hydrolase
VVNGPEKSPATFLADAGFDVWVINLRGGFHSRSHTTLDPNTDEEYWDINIGSFIEDYRATVNHILQLTGYEAISFVGISHGAISMLVSLAQDPDWFTPRVNRLVAMAPTATLDHITHPIDVIRLLQNAGVYSLIEES